MTSHDDHFSPRLSIGWPDWTTSTRQTGHTANQEKPKIEPKGQDPWRTPGGFWGFWGVLGASGVGGVLLGRGWVAADTLLKGFSCYNAENLI
jgi:hypothetical protein